jgi:urea carboxylase
LASFGSAGLYLEKFVSKARHIEVQIFGDGAGAVVALGERDCSAQRRHQKVIEETPAPRLMSVAREKLFEMARRLGAAVRYQSAGTVEFIYDDATAEIYFLEVNTRLQVEHGVTEEVTGIDLVEWMIRQAAREMPPLADIKIQPAGCSIQVRIYAEDPAKNFQPSAGRLSKVDWPARARVETWVESGSEITPHYDPMLAKIIVRGESCGVAPTAQRFGGMHSDRYRKQLGLFAAGDYGLGVRKRRHHDIVLADVYVSTERARRD